MTTLRTAAARLALLPLAALVAACGEPETDRVASEAEAGEARTGGTAVVGGRGEIPSVNPLVSPDLVSAQVGRFVLFTPLVRLDEELRPRPRLAREWEFDPDSSAVVFRLREDLRWHDGEPVTARDVAFTFRRVKDPAVPYPNRSYFATWDSVEVLGPHTLRFALSGVTAEPLYGWSRLPVLPAHVLGEVPPERLAEHPFGTTAPVGNGPFRFREHRPGDRWVFEANPDFPEGLGGPPRLDRLVYRVVPDATTLLAELRAGEVDFYMSVTPAQARRLRDAEGVRVLSTPWPSYSFVAWNTRREPFDDVRVRRAFALAMDRRGMVQSVLEGRGRVSTGPLGGWHWAHDPSRRPLAHAPDSARTLLERAGWRDADGDGIRERNGRELSFELAVNQSPTRRDLAVMIQADLREVGARVEVRTGEWAAFQARVVSPDRDFDAFIVAITQDLVFDDRDFFACDRRDQPLAFSGWCDPDLDPVLDSIPLAAGRERRRRLLREYDRRVYRAQPYAFLFSTERLAGVRDELRGVGLDMRGDLVDVAEWWKEGAGR